MTNELKHLRFSGNGFAEYLAQLPITNHDCIPAQTVDVSIVMLPSERDAIVGALKGGTPSPERDQEITYNVGRWLSAALDDETVCQEMKDDIIAWMEAGRPNDHTWPERDMLKKCVEALRSARIGVIDVQTEDDMLDTVKQIDEALNEAKRVLGEGESK